MATIALMIGGAVLNATAFVGGSYLAKYLSGSNTDTERIRHDKALEKYQRDYAAYQEKRQRLLDWYNQQRDEEHQASQNLSNTDEALNSIVRHILITLFKNLESLITTDRVTIREWVRWSTSEEGCWLWVTSRVNFCKVNNLKDSLLDK